ncbi:MAG: AraC family transcriptional regulator, partial [Proteobacteria bacterium]
CRQALEDPLQKGRTVSEIAYGLGFEHAQSFSTLFKKKTRVSPMEFRQSFN